MQRILSVVYAPHRFHWSLFVPNASPEQVHGSLSHTVQDRAWSGGPPTLVYEPKRQMLDQRPESQGDPQRRIYLSYAMSPGGTFVSADQRACGEMAITWRAILIVVLSAGIWGLIGRAWLPGVMFLTLFIAARVGVEALERCAARKMQSRILAAAGPLSPSAPE